MKNPIPEISPAFDSAAITNEKLFARQESQTPGEKFLVFELGEELFAISTKNVVEAASSLDITFLPHSPSWLLGIANLRGEVISVVNLPKLLHKQTSTRLSKPKFIVLRSDVFEIGVAFKVDRISDILRVPTTEIEFNKDTVRSFFLGRTLHKSQKLVLLDSENLLAALNLD